MLILLHHFFPLPFLQLFNFRVHTFNKINFIGPIIVPDNVCKNAHDTLMFYFLLKFGNFIFFFIVLVEMHQVWVFEPEFLLDF